MWIGRWWTGRRLVFLMKRVLAGAQKFLSRIQVLVFQSQTGGRLSVWPDAADRAEIDPFLLEGPRLFTDKRRGKTRGAESQRGGVEGRQGRRGSFRFQVTGVLWVCRGADREPQGRVSPLQCPGKFPDPEGCRVTPSKLCPARPTDSFKRSWRECGTQPPIRPRHNEIKL